MQVWLIHKSTVVAKVALDVLKDIIVTSTVYVFHQEASIKRSHLLAFKQINFKEPMMKFVSTLFLKKKEIRPKYKLISEMENILNSLLNSMKKEEVTGMEEILAKIGDTLKLHSFYQLLEESNL